MQGILESFTTDELGTINMNTSKAELIMALQDRGIKYRETERTLTLKNYDRTNMIYFIFSDSLDKIILVDLGNIELRSVKFDGIEYNPTELKQGDLLNWSHTMRCNYKKKNFKVGANFKVACSTGIDCRMCGQAGKITHEAKYGNAIISYIDFGDDLGDILFCLENNDGEHVNFRRIRKEDREALKSAKL